MNSPAFTRFSHALENAPENSLSLRYLEILSRWIPHGMATFASWPVRPRSGHFYGGVLWYCQETVMPALAIATAASSPAYHASAGGFSRDELKETALKALRYACFTHDTGPGDCLRPTKSWGRTEPAGTKWGERGKGFFRETNAGRQVANLAGIASLIRELLGDEEREMLSAIAEDYLARYLDYRPPSGLYFNTQMEENAWTAFGLAGAALLLDQSDEFPDRLSRIEEWMIHATTTPDDMHDSRPGPQGRTIREWADQRFTTLPDFTAENHGFVHPSYLKSSITLLGQMGALLRLWGYQVPDAATHHHREIYRVIADWCDDLGVPHAPQGMDWPYVNFTSQCLAHAAAAVNLELPDASLLESRSLDALETESLVHDGRLIPEATEAGCHGQQDPAIMQERFICHIAYAYLLRRLSGVGPAASDDADFRARQSGVHVYPHGGVAIHAHSRGKTSVGWRNGSMVLPATNRGIALIGQARSSLLGSVEVAGRGASTSLSFVNPRNGPDRFCCSFEELLAEETVRRRAVAASFSDGVCFVWERIDALHPLTVERLVQGRLSVMNDPVFATTSPASSTRRIVTDGAEAQFAGIAAAPDQEIATQVLPLSRWVQVDDEFGIVFESSEPARYTNPHSWTPWHAVEDWIDLGGFDTPRRISGGETIGWCATLWLPESTAEQTAAARFELVSSGPDTVLARITAHGTNRLVCTGFGNNHVDIDRALLASETGTLALGPGIIVTNSSDTPVSISIPPREPVMIESV